MNLSTVTLKMNREAVRARSGTGITGILAIACTAVGSAIAFLLAGGTWMFWQRSKAAENVAGVGGASMYWFDLAVIACALLIPALFNLTAQAAVAGAAGKERRLATLRLIGLSAHNVVRMGAVETAFQSGVGIVLGGMLSVLIAPVFTHVSFQDHPVEPQEIILPWWGYVMVAAVLLSLAVGASLAGLRRVSVSPLGVARRQVPSQRLWVQVVVGAATAIAAFYIDRTVDPGQDVRLILAIVAPILLIGVALNFFAPPVVGLIARATSVFPGGASFIATRRVIANPKIIWRRVSAIVLLSFLAGYLVCVLLVTDSTFSEEDEVSRILFQDVATGSILIVIFGFVMALMSILVGQVNGVLEDAHLSRSMHSIGVPRRLSFWANFWETMGPAIILGLIGFAFGGLLSLAMLGKVVADSSTTDIIARVSFALSLLFAGWTAIALSLAAVEPLRSTILHDTRRKE